MDKNQPNTTENICVRVCMLIGVRACIREYTHTHTHAHTHKIRTDIYKNKTYAETKDLQEQLNPVEHFQIWNQTKFQQLI